MLELHGGKKVPIIFPADLEHYDVAHAMITSNPTFLGGVVSAGDISIDRVHLMPSEKNSLGIESQRGDDLEIMAHDHFGSVSQADGYEN